MPIGPQLPPHLQKKFSGADDKGGSAEDSEPRPHEDSDDDDCFAPALPPDLAVRRPQAGPALPSTVGPNLPPSVNAFGPSTSSVPADDDSDDEYGPMPPPAGAEAPEEEDGVKEFVEREKRRQQKLEVCLSICRSCPLSTFPAIFLPSNPLS